MSKGKKKVKKLRREDYDDAVKDLQRALSHLAHWLAETGSRIVVVLEGRDTAGKGGVIGAMTQRFNPRQAHIVALPKPSDRERSQWHFQRYVPHLPAAGELVFFDRSWYNRAGVERVMGFCSEAEVERFLHEAPIFEKMLTDDGILLFKYWLSVDQAQQEERFAERASDPLKRWKLSPIDHASRLRYEAYGDARDRMFERTHTAHAPWTVVDFNDQRRGRLNLIRDFLDRVPDNLTDDREVELPPLPGPPKIERFTGPVQPIDGAF